MHELIVVTGPVDSGKTTLLFAWLSRLDMEFSIRFGGIGTPVPLPGEPKTEREIFDVRTGEVRVAMRQIPEPGWLRCGKFWYDPSVFDWANFCVGKAFEVSDMLVFDEIGLLELEGKGMHRSFADALQSFQGTIVAVVRECLLEKACLVYGIDKEQTRILRSRVPLEDQYLIPRMLQSE